MNILEDTRQQSGKHKHKHEYFQLHNIHVTRCKLPVGDYALFPTISVDTKQNMSEIASNIGGKEHVRFREECKLARDNGCRLVILVENDDGITDVKDVCLWRNPRRFDNPKAITGERLQKAMQTMSARYGVEFMFCKPSESAERIEGILNGTI